MLSDKETVANDNSSVHTIDENATEVSNSVADVKAAETTTPANTAEESKSVSFSPETETGGRESEDRSETQDADVLSQFPSSKTLPQAEIVKDDRKQDVESKNVVHYKKPPKEHKGIIEHATKYTKLSICALLLFVFASIFANVYQAFAGDCTELNEELDRLATLNTAFRDQISQLDVTVKQLAFEVYVFEEQNKELENTISDIYTTDGALELQIESLEELVDRYETIAETNYANFEAFQADMTAWNADVDSANGDIRVSVADLGDQVAAVDSIYEATKSNREVLEQSLTNMVDELNDSLENTRFQSAFRSIRDALQDDDEIEGQQVDVFLDRVTSIYFFSSSPYRPTFEVQTLDLNSSLDLIEQIQTDSRADETALWVSLPL